MPYATIVTNISEAEAITAAVERRQFKTPELRGAWLYNHFTVVSHGVRIAQYDATVNGWVLDASPWVPINARHHYSLLRDALTNQQTDGV